MSTSVKDSSSFSTVVGEKFEISIRQKKDSKRSSGYNNYGTWLLLYFIPVNVLHIVQQCDRLHRVHTVCLTTVALYDMFSIEVFHVSFLAV